MTCGGGEVGAGSYRLKVESNEFNLEDLGGSYNHVTALLKASSSGEARVGLTQGGVRQN